MTTLRTVIADDEYWAIKRLETQLNTIEGVECIASAKDGAEAWIWICSKLMPYLLNSASMPNVRASSGTIGTTRRPISLSRSSFDSSRTNTIVVDALRPSVPP